MFADNTLAFIGSGIMAEAMIRGLINQKLVDPKQIISSDPRADRAQELQAQYGIQVTVTMLDSAQYVERTNNYEFDMTWYDRALSLSPGNEQMLYWGRAGVTEPGTRNWMGMDSPAAEAMIAEMLTAASPEDYRAAVHALDRILTAGRYVIPAGYSPISRLAHDSALKFPAEIPVYGDYPGFLPETWWREDGAN